MRAPETSGDEFYIHPTDGLERTPWNEGMDNGKIAACIPAVAIITVAAAMAIGAALNDKPATNNTIQQAASAQLLP